MQSFSKMQQRRCDDVKRNNLNKCLNKYRLFKGSDTFVEETDHQTDHVHVCDYSYCFNWRESVNGEDFGHYPEHTSIFI